MTARRCLPSLKKRFPGFQADVEAGRPQAVAPTFEQEVPLFEPENNVTAVSKGLQPPDVLEVTSVSSSDDSSRPSNSEEVLSASVADRERPAAADQQFTPAVVASPQEKSSFADFGTELPPVTGDTNLFGAEKTEPEKSPQDLLADAIQDPTPDKPSPPADSQPNVPAAQEPTLIAMLEPVADVNLFDDGRRPDTFEPPVQKSVAPDPPRPAETQPFERATADTQPSDPPAETSSAFVPEPQPAGRTLTHDEPSSDTGGFAAVSETPKALHLPGAVPSNTDRADVGVARFVEVERAGVQQVAGVARQCEICEVKPNDTYWTISRRAYGTARYFSSLALYNRHRISDPKKLRPGMKVLIPAPEVLEQQYPELFRGFRRTPKQPSGYFLLDDGSPAYRVGERETLSEISQKHLGRASRWMQIYRLNRNILSDPNKLKPGIVIALPEDATDVHMAP